MKVAFVGVGGLGAAMAGRLADVGLDLIACDLNPAALAPFEARGVEVTTDALEAARAADVLATCVRMDADLERLVAGGALFEALGAGGIFLIHSTVAPALVRELAALGRGYGVEILDAGVSGGAGPALKGQLSIYVGGEAEAFERARPVLDALGTSTLFGPAGRGMEGKLLNNLVSIANYGMAAAVLDLGDKLGFEREVLRGALMAGSAEGFALRMTPTLLRPDGAAQLEQVLSKDLDHARALAPETDPAMAALTHAAEAMIARLRRD